MNKQHHQGRLSSRNLTPCHPSTGAIYGVSGNVVHRAEDILRRAVTARIIVAGDG